MSRSRDRVSVRRGGRLRSFTHWRISSLFGFRRDEVGMLVGDFTVLYGCLGGVIAEVEARFGHILLR